MMFVINGISFDPCASGSARRSARPSVICNLSEIFTPAVGVPQPLGSRCKYSGGFPQLARLRACASQVAVERTTDSGNPALAVKSFVTGVFPRISSLCRPADRSDRTAIKHNEIVSFLALILSPRETFRPAGLPPPGFSEVTTR